jgi:transcriptional regulator with XRE-family HTH domain
MADKTLYNKIRAELILGQKKNLELAKYMDVSVSTVSDWCTNTNQPSIQDLYRIAEFLQIDVRRLLYPTYWDSNLTKAAEEEPVFKRAKTTNKKSKGKK